MGVNRVNFSDPVMSLGPVCGSAGPIGNVVMAAQPEMAPQVAAAPSAPAITRGMA